MGSQGRGYCSGQYTAPCKADQGCDYLKMMKISKMKDVDILSLHSLYEGGWTQSRLGELVGVDARTIGRWFINNGLSTRNKCPNELYDKIWLYNEYHVDGKSVSEIAEEVKCSTTLVYNVIKKFSIPPKHPEHNKTYPELNNKEWLFTQYITLKRSTVDIANDIGCETSSVLRKIYKYGIESRGRSASRKGKEFTTEHKIRLSETRKKLGIAKGERNPNWKGGISFEPYCYKFNKPLKQQIREKYNNKCILCGKTELNELEELNRHLSVHHIDYDKEQGCNGKTFLLVPLCCSCNCKVNYNRDEWQNKILTIINGGDYHPKLA